MKTKTKIELLAMLMIGSAACGGDEKPSVSANNTANNISNNTTTTPTNNTTASTNNNTTTPVTPDGAITLVSPTGEISANANVTLVFEIGDDVESVTLLIDGAAADAITSPYVFELDTTSMTEGGHLIGVEYVVGGETLRAEDLLSIIVDRSAPALLDSLPVDGETTARNAGPVRLMFDEPIDPGSLGAMTATIGGQTGTIWIEDENDVLIDFDWASLATPYDATIDYSGLRDAAGNEAAGSVTWAAPAYLAEAVGDLAKPFWYMANGTEMMIGSRRNATGAELVAMQGEATDNDHKDWIIIESISAAEVVDFDVAVHDGTAYIAAVLRTAPNGNISTQLALYSLAPGATDFVVQLRSMPGAP